MIFAEHVAHDTRGLHVLGVPANPHAVHVDQNAALNGLLPVGYFRKRAALDDGHRVFEICLRSVARQHERAVLFRVASHGKRYFRRRITPFGFAGSFVISDSRRIRFNGLSECRRLS